MNKRKALVTASVASMIDLFSMDNIHILQELGFEVDVASNFAFGSITSQERVDAFRMELEEEGICAIHVPIPRSISDIKNIYKSYVQLKKLIEAEEYQLIHTQSPIGSVVTRLAARDALKQRKRTGGKYPQIVYTAHGFHFFKGAPLQNWLLFYPIERALARYTDSLLVMNEEDYFRAKKFGVSKINIVPGIGIEPEKYQEPMENRDEVRARFGFSNEDFVLISVGQLSKRKNQETAIRAIAKIPDVHVKYLIVGLGEKEAEFNELIEKLGVQDRIVLSGYREDIRDLLQAADACIFPSLQEGLPVALQEAMAAGLPIVASDIRGNRDLITDRVEGILVSPKDEDGFSAAIMEIVEHPDKTKSFGEHAQKKIQKYTKQEVQRCIREVYCRVLEG